MQHVLTVDEQSKLKRLTSTQTRLTMGEFCAGMGTGTIAAAGLSRVVQEALGCCLNMSTVFYTEIPWKQEVIKRVHGAVDLCGPSPVIFRKTGDLAALANPLQCMLACKAIECDDISALSPTPRSVVDKAGRSGSSFVEFIAYLARLSPDRRPKFILVEGEFSQAAKGSAGARNVCGQREAEESRLPGQMARVSVAPAFLFHGLKNEFL